MLTSSFYFQAWFKSIIYMNAHFIRLTSFLLLKAQSSRVSAASYFPCLLYKAPKFFNVVVTVGESTFAALCQPPYSP